MSTVYFLDIEASSLSAVSHPIEIAWVDQDGTGESWLIRPAPDWQDWSAESEAVHGISRRILEEEGCAHEAVARRAADVLAPQRALVFADQPAFDGEWLWTLLKAAGLGGIPVLDVMKLYGQACRPLRGIIPDHDKAQTVARQVVAAAQAAAAARPGQRHRALPDAERLWWTWREIERRIATMTGDRSGAAMPR